VGAFSHKFSIAPSGETTDRMKKVRGWGCRNGTELLYHHAKYGGDPGSRTGCITKKSDVFCLSVFTARCICISPVYAVTRCPSVYASVTFVSCAKTNRDIFEIFSPSGSDTILVFPYQRGCRYSDGSPPKGASNRRGYEKLTIFDQYLALSQKRL